MRRRGGLSWISAPRWNAGPTPDETQPRRQQYANRAISVRPLRPNRWPAPCYGAHAMADAASPLADAPEREDVRFLGRLLGDVIRAQEGEPVFARIEAIRKAAIAVHRIGGAAHAEGLAARLDELSISDTLRFARGFTCFSL